MSSETLQPAFSIRSITPSLASQSNLDDLFEDSVAPEDLSERGQPRSPRRNSAMRLRHMLNSSRYALMKNLSNRRTTIKRSGSVNSDEQEDREDSTTSTSFSDLATSSVPGIPSESALV